MYLSHSAPAVVGACSKKTVSSFGYRIGMFLSVVLATFSFNAFASCQYIVTNQGESWFGGAIRITNTGTAPINGWSVSWKYTGSNLLVSSWNANVTGTNPYTATNVSWNGVIAVGQSAEFGVQGSKTAGLAEVPVVSGAVCDAVASSSVASQSSSKSSSSLVSSSVSSSRSSSSSLRSSSIASSIKSSSSSVISSVASSTSSIAGGQCNWYGTLYPLCVTTTSGWGYENNKSCIARVTCAAQPAPYGIVGETISSAASSSRSSVASSIVSSIASSIKSSAKSSSAVSSSSIKSSAPSSSSFSSVKSSSSSLSSNSGAEFTGMSTHFDGLGVPYGGCGIPQEQLETQSFVALNVFNTPGVYSFWPRPLAGSDLQYIGEFNNGKNCGRWVRVTVQEFCNGTNDGAQSQPFCRGGLGWVKDGYEGATQDMLVADSCGDSNAWCRDSRYHLDFSLASMSLFSLNGTTVNLLPGHDNNRKISWHYIEAPNYTGDIKIYFMAGAQVWWPAIAINNLQNGIHGVEQLVNGVWTAMPMNTDLGQAYILQSGSAHYQIRVRDVNDQLINGGRVYNFDLPASCNGRCSAAVTPVTYSIQ